MSFVLELGVCASAPRREARRTLRPKGRPANLRVSAWRRSTEGDGEGKTQMTFYEPAGDGLYLSLKRKDAE